MWLKKCVLILVFVSWIEAKAAPPQNATNVKHEINLIKMDENSAHVHEVTTGIPKVNLLTLIENDENLDKPSAKQPDDKLHETVNNQETESKKSDSRPQMPIPSQEHAHNSNTENPHKHDKNNEQILSEKPTVSFISAPKQDNKFDQKLKQEHDSEQSEKFNLQLTQHTDGTQAQVQLNKQHENIDYETAQMHFHEQGNNAFKHGQNKDNAEKSQLKVPAKFDGCDEEHIAESKNTMKPNNDFLHTQQVGSFASGVSTQNENVNNKPQNPQMLPEKSEEPYKFESTHIQKLNRPQEMAELLHKLNIPSPFASVPNTDTNFHESLQKPTGISQGSKTKTSEQNSMKPVTSQSEGLKPMHEDQDVKVSDTNDHVHIHTNLKLSTKEPMNVQTTPHSQPLVPVNLRVARATSDTPKRKRPASSKTSINNAAATSPVHNDDKLLDQLANSHIAPPSFALASSANENNYPAYPNSANYFNNLNVAQYPNPPPYPFLPNNLNYPNPQQNLRYPNFNIGPHVPHAPYLPSPYINNKLPFYPYNEAYSNFYNRNPNFALLPNFPNQQFFQNLPNYPNRLPERESEELYETRSPFENTGNTDLRRLSRPAMQQLLNTPSLLNTLRRLLKNNNLRTQIQEWLQSRPRPQLANQDPQIADQETRFNTYNYENYIENYENPIENLRIPTTPGQKQTALKNKFLESLPKGDLYDVDAQSDVKDAQKGPVALLENGDGTIYYQQSNNGDLPEPVEGWSTIVLPAGRKMPGKRANKDGKREDKVL